jgi:hypothetical protein
MIFIAESRTPWFSQAFDMQGLRRCALDGFAP